MCNTSEKSHFWTNTHISLNIQATLLDPLSLLRPLARLVIKAKSAQDYATGHLSFFSHLPMKKPPMLPCPGLHLLDTKKLSTSYLPLVHMISPNHATKLKETKKGGGGETTLIPKNRCLQSLKLSALISVTKLSPRD